MSVIRDNVKNKQASENTIYHALYGHYYLKYSIDFLSKVYVKDRSTIYRWIKNYENDGLIKRKQKESVYIKFDAEKRAWLGKLYTKRPILTLEEASRLFYAKYKEQISSSSISFILHEHGLTWKRLERRAVQISLTDISRFTLEINSIKWINQSLVFLDEVSFDNKGMLRKNGYGLKGKSLVFRGEFCRKSRVSALCFLGSDGLLNCYTTEGTFDRHKFVYYIRKFVLDNDSLVDTYPGRYSVFIMDGAAIHLDENLVSYLRSMGLLVVFLPAYSPFFMPIEIVFGLMKRALRKIYTENSKTPLEHHISRVLKMFSNRDMTKIFKKCGYLPNGTFDPSIGLQKDSEYYKDTGFDH